MNYTAAKVCLLGEALKSEGPRLHGIVTCALVRRTVVSVKPDPLVFFRGWRRRRKRSISSIVPYIDLVRCPDSR